MNEITPCLWFDTEGEDAATAAWQAPRRTGHSCRSAQAEPLTPNVAAHDITVVGQKKARSTTKYWPCGVELCLP